MLGSHGAAASECTVTGADSAPPEVTSTRYPFPGDTFWNSNPPRLSAAWVKSVFPRGEMSDAWAEGARPVTYTCSALPTALKLGVAAEALIVVSMLTTRNPQIVTTTESAVRLLRSITPPWEPRD